MKPEMSKKNVRSIIIFALCLVIFNIITFVIPFEHSAAFWSAYVFGMIAILSQIGVVFLSLNKKFTHKQKFYAFPIIRMGVDYHNVQLVVSFIFFIAATFTASVKGWIPTVISAILLCVFTILVLLNDSTRDTIEKIEENEERNTVHVKTFRLNIDSILRRTDDKDLLRVLEKLSDTAKYSDPVSSDKLYYIENEITEKVMQLDNAVRSGDKSAAIALCEEAIKLFEDRNAMCKAYKR